MNIGFTSIYPYRGSIHNMIYLAKIFEYENHSIFFLKCNSSVPSCYNQLIKGSSKKIECLKCQIGGVSSFDVKNIQKIDSRVSADLSKQELDSIVESTSYSLHRIETRDECYSEEVNSTSKLLYPSANIVYQNTLNWLEENKLDLVFVFNGRLDLPRAVVQACKFAKIPFITFEAAYPGVALEVNDDCRSIKSLHNIVTKFIDKPLTNEQASYAGKIAAQMLNKTNLVWRLYNTVPDKGYWPNKSSTNKILIVPSSSHEFMGVESWTPEWNHFTEGVECVLNAMGINISDCVLRCHPNWSENIGTAKDGKKSEDFYTKWCSKNNISMIPSYNKINTNDLIKEADIIIVQYGTAGIEAGLLGKKVIGLYPSFYSNANFSIQIHKKADLSEVNKIQQHNNFETIRKALRFLYCYHKRFAQYTNYIKPISVFENEYYHGAETTKILQALESNTLIEDDANFYHTTDHENKIIEQLASGEFKNLIDWKELKSTNKKMNIRRKHAYQLIEYLRNNFKSGDA